MVILKGLGVVQAMKKPKAPKHEFHVLSTSFEPASGRRGKGWWLEFSPTLAQKCSIYEGKSIPPLGPEFFVIADDPARREDFPDLINPFFLIVSERARAVMEQETPENCQFLPIDVKHKGVVIDSSYSIVNCLHLLACIDEVRSAPWNIERNWLPSRQFIRVEIDPSRVPQEVGIFRVVDHYLSTFIRERVRLAFKKAKLTGWTAWQG